MDEIKKLAKIWDSIPNSKSQQVELSVKKIVKKYLDLFHFGDYFYVVFNTQTTEMEFVDPGVEKVLGIAPKEFTLEWILGNLHSEDSPYYFHYEKSAVKFFTSLDKEHFFKYKFSYDYRLRTEGGIYKRVLQQVVPVYYFPQGGARTLAIFTDLTHLNITGIPKLSFIGMEEAPSYYNVHLTEEFNAQDSLLSPREKEILGFVIQGHTSQSIADRLCRSVHTVRTHRKNILEKSGCISLQELIARSVREGWI
ncbi:LuxR C-terminal-related transcriptional regulator [Chryseobacterium sp. A301]